jgi:Protein of unknown function (DUF1549)/Protein of unknown function (DUF1553)
MRMLRALLPAAISILTAMPIAAADLLPPDRAIEQVVVHYVDDLIKQENIMPAPAAGDATILRRLSLDLIGRIPTAAETKAYVESTDPEKKTKLVDRLMASPAFVRCQAVMFDAMINSGDLRNNVGLRDYFVRALGDNRSWSQIFRELVTPDPNDPKQKGSIEFLKPRLADLDKLTNEVSVIFFGVNVSCAQCHDHPLVNDWKQDHFFGMKTFFARTFDNGGFVAEREFGLLKFKPNKGAEKQARALFLTGGEVDLPNSREATNDEQKKEKEKFDNYKKNKTQPPAPAASARAKLVETALQSGNSEFFSKSIVNRMWRRFFGLGLVNPLDQMHSENPPSHPELLLWLARDTAAHQYNLRRLIRGLVLSQAYARDSKYPSEAQPNPKFFAVARLKPLTPMQMATSLKIAAGDPIDFENRKPDEFEKKIEQIENNVRGFASQFAAPTDDFQIGVNEALLFTNSNKVAQELLAEGDGSLLGRVKQMKDEKQALELIIQSTMCRPATADELQTFGEYIQKRTDRRLEAYRQVVWALLASAEFRFNY